MGACETTPHTSAGNQHATPDNPIATGPFLALDDLPPLAGVKLVRPRRCAAQSREVKSPVVMSRVVALTARVVRTGPLVDRDGSVTIVPSTGGPVAHPVCHDHDHPCRHRR